MQKPDTQSTSTPDKKTSDYFDLHATGIGYLRRARSVTPDNGSTYLAVTIAGSDISTRTSTAPCLAAKRRRSFDA